MVTDGFYFLPDKTDFSTLQQTLPEHLVVFRALCSRNGRSKGKRDDRGTQQLTVKQSEQAGAANKP